MAQDPEVHLEHLIDLIDKEDQVNNQSKSALKKRLHTFNKGPKHALQSMGKKARQRVEREAAYDWVNKEVNKWQEVVAQESQMRTLDLQQPAYITTTIEQFTNNPRPSALQQEIGEIFHEPDEEEPEETGLSDRIGARSRLMYEYQKQKRQAKIKSKLYHKRKKRQREKSQGEEEDDQAKAEFLRAQERLSLRHSKGRFRKNMARFVKFEHDLRNQAVDNHAKLKERIRNISRVNSEGTLAYDSSSDDDEQYLLEQLQQGLDEETPTTGVLGMKFMQEALRQKRERAKAEAQELLKELQGEEVEEDGAVSKFRFEGDGKPVKKRKVKEVKEVVKQDAETQRLVDRAFEMDQVAAEEWAKEYEEAEEKKPKQRRGWGSWTGSGMRAPAPPPKPTVFPTEKTLVNKDRNKKTTKFLVSQLPYPYRTARQYDEVHKVPIGKDWNSHRVYQEFIAPEVMTTPGQVIAPISEKDKQRSMQ